MDLESLVAAQESFKLQIQRIGVNYGKLAKAKRTPAAIKNRLESLNKLQEICLNHHEEIISQSDQKIRAENTYFILDFYGEISESIQEVRDLLTDALQELEPKATPLHESTTFVDGPSACTHIDLKPINIPKFSGELDQWVEFRDLFSALIDNRTDLSRVQKLHYLKSAVEGHAARILRKIRITDANYEAAWTLLKRRYEDPLAILYAYFNDFMTIPSVGPNRYKDLQNLRDVSYDIYNDILGLDRPIKAWEDLFIYLVLNKLDQQTRQAWELNPNKNSIFPTFDELDYFLSQQIRALSHIPTIESASDSKCSSLKGKPNSVKVNHTSSNSMSCSVCSEEHPLYKCSKFQAMSVDQRIETLKKQERCFNCFRKGHRPRTCPSKNTCRVCKMKHHTLVHITKILPNTTLTSSETAGAPSPSPAGVSTSANSVDVCRNSTFLPTATVLVRSPSGRSTKVRALLDQGAQASFISNSVLQTLGLRKIPVSVNVSGIGALRAGTIKYATEFLISPSNDSQPQIPMKALVLYQVSQYLPPPSQPLESLPYLETLRLADECLSTSGPVQLIIGADYLHEFTRDGLVRGPSGYPIAQLTVFGWVLSGPAPALRNDSPPRLVVNHIALDDLTTAVTKFWELEEVPKKTFQTEEEILCENHFSQNFSRTSKGRYCVSLPFKFPPPIPLGLTRSAVSTLFLRQESRLAKNLPLKRKYDEFLREYLDLGHMIPVSNSNPNAEEGETYYLPHHPVMKRDDKSEKIRVVFNASFKSSNGKSLNDCLMTGPKLQADLFKIILRWRSHRIVVCTDLEKMFRQILVSERDANFQRILWREHKDEDIKIFKLCTVTYGTSCAPFLANRIIRQLIKDEGHRFPLAAKILERDIYVDDVMFGVDDPSTLKEACTQLIQLLMAGGFRCHKWASNSREILDRDIDTDGTILAQKFLGEDLEHKILGIYWSEKEDTFSFSIKTIPAVSTKRTFLSMIARIFDPLGWASPVTITAKILFQAMWLQNLKWDKPMSSGLLERCQEFKEQLLELNKIKIPRWTMQRGERSRVEVHGFADASHAAYAACVYLRVENTDHVHSTLVLAKTKVAPVKVQSVPRLELCAAALLTRAVAFVVDSMGLSSAPVVCWTDSMVVLSWLQDHPSRWKVFVANRVSEIKSSLPNAEWRHVSSHDNPADCASRGIAASHLPSHSLWWTGPAWLILDSGKWPVNKVSEPADEDMKQRPHSALTCSSVKNNIIGELSERVSTWQKLIRIVAYIRRFLEVKNSGSQLIASNFLCVPELRQAIITICRTTQLVSFPETFASLEGKGNAIVEPSLRSLCPVLDSNHLLRVGGRLSRADMAFDRKHPIILPSGRVSKLLARHYHHLSLHGGLQVTLRLLRQQFWVLNGRSIVKNCIRSCVTCARYRAELTKQQMGDLPAPRIVPSRPFSHTGVDYAGPFSLRTSGGRGHKTHKGYLILFICLATRAIHMECVNDYSSAGFLAAFNRFAARRGLPSNMYSDNGTNFVGAARELAVEFKRVLQDPEVQNRLVVDQVQWNFIPPAAPHFGGLWEAGVKSVKHHLRRIMGSLTPTFEEFYTLLCKIEAVLNSRPISPLRDDPSDLNALTPGHFLVGDCVALPPAESILHLNPNRLSRWQAIQRLHESFWHAWSHDYLNSLQQRHKWQRPVSNLQEGDLVIVKHPQLPPGKWELGRILETVKGKDNLVRVVKVRTVNSTYLRPVHQLCKLPVESHIESPK